MPKSQHNSYRTISMLLIAVCQFSINEYYIIIIIVVVIIYLFVCSNTIEHKNNIITIMNTKFSDVTAPYLLSHPVMLGNVEWTLIK